MQPLIINCALTGMIGSKDDNKHIPLLPHEIIRDGIMCAKEGATILHIHERSNSLDNLGFIIKNIKRSVDVLICVSTSGRYDPRLSQRTQVLMLNDECKPDLASITMSSLNFSKDVSQTPPDTIKGLLDVMRIKNIKPELEIFDSGMINAVKYWNRKELINGPMYCNMIMGSLYGAQSKIEDISYMVNKLPDDIIWSVGGISESQLPVNVASIIMGGHVRTGLEDNLWYDNERKDLTNNRHLVLRIVRLANELNRPLATVDETRGMLGI